MIGMLCFLSTANIKHKNSFRVNVRTAATCMTNEPRPVFRKTNFAHVGRAAGFWPEIYRPIFFLTRPRFVDIESIDLGIFLIPNS